MDNSFSDLLKSSLDSIREVADVNTVIGEPIHTPSGTTIIPVSKVSLGFASGGFDNPKNKTDKTEEQSAGDKSAKPTKNAKTFSGGGGSGVTITPVAFLVISPGGGVELLDLKENNAKNKNNLIDSFTDLLTKSPDIISRLKDALENSGTKKASDSDDVLGDDKKYGFDKDCEPEQNNG